MPDAATLNATMQTGRQMSASAPQTQQAPAMNQPMAATQANMGTQLRPQRLPNSPPAIYPGVQAVVQSPAGSNPAFGQIQQQVYQQPIMQQPIAQPAPMNALQPPVQSWTQSPNLALPAQAVNSPASVQYR
jgi:hypothetical protein